MFVYQLKKQKQNIKLYTNLTCSELAHMNVLPLPHVDALREAQPLAYQ